MSEPKYLKAGKWLDWDGVLKMLGNQIVDAGGQAEWAKAHNISYEYVRLVMSGKRIPGAMITKAMGLEKALMWRLPHGRTQ